MKVALDLSYRNTTRFNQFRNHYERFVDKNVTPTFTLLNVGLTAGTSSYKYILGGVTVGDKVYFFPYNETRILVIDSTDDSYYYIGNFIGTAKFHSTYLAPNGYIYSFGSYGSVLKFNPKDETYSTFGTISGFSGEIRGSKIYCLVNSTTFQFKIIDTENDTIYDDTSFTGGLSGQSYVAREIGINNKMYFLINLATNAGVNRLGIVDFETKSVTYKDVPTNTTRLDAPPWYKGISHPNGKIYFNGFVDSRWLIIDTLNNDAISYSNTITSNLNNGKGQSCGMGGNGKMYQLPVNNLEDRGNFQELDTDTDVSIKIHDAQDLIGTFSRAYYGCQLVANGNIYGAPTDVAHVLKIEINSGFSKEFTDSQWYNNR